MAQKLRFPDGFLWGAATSSYQIEGGIENNDWAGAARLGKVPSAGRACDHYNRYEEDFDIAKSLGHNAHRLSIEWGRIEPEEGKFDEQAITHYREVLAALRARGLAPMVTLWHFTLPLWLSQQGGVQHKHFPDYFARYCAYATEQLGDDRILFTTINEPLVFAALGWIRGVWPPFKRRSFLRYLPVTRQLARAHNLAYRAIKEKHPTFTIGIVKNNKYVYSNANPLNILAAEITDWYWNRWFLNRTYRNTDFIGLNYYFHQSFGKEERLPRSDMGWPIFPEGICHVLLELARYQKPIYVTENGIADAADDKRAYFIREHLYQIHKAIEGGAPVKGYFYWSLLDNFEWAEGFEKRFGLVEINYKTLERRVRPSAHVYEKICRTNTLEY